MFAAFEGVDGCGKSTLIEAVRERLAKMGEQAIITSELNRQDQWSITARSRLCQATTKQEQLEIILRVRRIHLYEVLHADHNKDVHILMDRFLLSTLAYQHEKGSLEFSYIMARHSRELLRIPRTTFLIKVRPEIAMERLRAKGKLDSFDSASLEVFRDRGYTFIQAARHLANAGWSVVFLNGEKPVSELCEQVLHHFETESVL